MTHIKLTKVNTDAILTNAVSITKNDLSNITSIDAVYNITKKSYELTMIYDTELMQNNLSIMIPLGLFTDVDEKTATYNIIDTLFNRHFQAMLRNDLLSA